MVISSSTSCSIQINCCSVDILNCGEAINFNINRSDLNLVILLMHSIRICISVPNFCALRRLQILNSHLIFNFLQAFIGKMFDAHLKTVMFFLMQIPPENLPFLLFILVAFMKLYRGLRYDQILHHLNRWHHLIQRPSQLLDSSQQVAPPHRGILSYYIHLNRWHHLRPSQLLDSSQQVAPPHTEAFSVMIRS